MMRGALASLWLVAVAAAPSKFIYKEIGGGKASYLLHTYHKTAESFRANGFMPFVEAAKYERQPQVRRMQDAYMGLSSRAMVIEKLEKRLGASDPIATSADDERVARTRIFVAMSTTGPTAVGFVSYWPEQMLIEAIAINPLFLEGGEAAEQALVRHIASLAETDGVKDLRLRFTERAFFQLTRAAFYTPCGFVGDARAMASLAEMATTSVAPASSPPDVTGPADGTWLPAVQDQPEPHSKEQQAKNWQARHYGASGIAMPGEAPTSEATAATTGGAAGWLDSTAVVELTYDRTALDSEKCSGEPPPSASVAAACNRRRLEGCAEGCASEEDWLLEWRQRIACWWEHTPHQAQLGGCVNALSAHLTNSLRRAMRTFGKDPLDVSTGASTPSVEEGCEWIEAPNLSLNLPEFPPLEGLRFTVPQLLNILPPLPQLTPWGVQKWQQLGAPRVIERGGDQGGEQPRAAAPQPALALGVLGGGVAAAAASLSWLAYRMSQRDAGRLQMSKRQMRPVGGGGV